MKRFHVHVAVEDLQKSIRFYSSVFAAPPTVLEEDYAKWALDDPKVNFAISRRGEKPGVNHLGVQVDSDEELTEMRVRLIEAQAPVLEQREASCCYSKSDKYWSVDPQGIAWETFHTLGSIPTFSGEAAAPSSAAGAAKPCCVPG